MLLFAMDSSLRWNDENQLVQSVHCELCVLCGPFVFPNIPYSSRSREARNKGALAESTSNTYLCTTGRTDQHSSAANHRLQLGRASCRECVCQYVETLVVAVSIKQQTK